MLRQSTFYTVMLSAAKHLAAHRASNYLYPGGALYLLRIKPCMNKHFRTISTVITNRRKHKTVRISYEMDMMTTQLVPALCTGVYIPKRQRSITQRAIFMSAKKTHRSILLQNVTEKSHK
jgi:hypothetical protein